MTTSSTPRPVLRRILIVIGALIGLLVLAAIAAIFFIDANRYKAEVEKTASDAFGMKITIEGNMGIAFKPGLHVTLENVRVHNRGTDLVFASEADVGLALLPLLNREIHYRSVSSKGARIYIERSPEGLFNYQREPVLGRQPKPLDLPRVHFADLDVKYTDKQSNTGMQFTGCAGNLDDVTHPGGAPFLKRVSLKGKFDCATVSNDTKNGTDLKFSVVATTAFRFYAGTLSAYGGKGTAKLHMDRAADVPTMNLDFKLAQLKVEQYFKPKAGGKSVSGPMDFTLNINMKGRGRQALRQSAQGEMTLSGTGLLLHGVNLDKELPKFASSQDFNLLDLGAVLFAGPVGLAVTKGYELTELTQRAEGDTPINKAVSTWKISNGVAQAQDVALVTAQNRLALQGGLNFVSNEYQDVTVALVDEYGCAKVRQKISGPFGRPVADKTMLIVPVSAVLRLVERAKSALSGKEKCDAFYNGSLPAPAVVADKK